MALWFLFITWAAAGLGAAITLIERREDIPQGWKRIYQEPSPTEPLVMSIALRQPQMHTLSDRITSGTRLSRGETLALRQPDEEESKSVLKWLSDNGITDARAEKDWIRVSTTVTKAEKLLQTKLHRYSFENKTPALRTTEYSVPDSVANAIDFIHPISNFMTPAHEMISQPISSSQSSHKRTPSACSTTTTPDCIKAQYNITYKTPDSKSPVRFAIGGFLDQFANYADADDFLRRTSPGIESSGYNFSVVFVNGGLNPQDRATAGAEANLDIEYASALGYPTEITFVSTGGKGVQLNDSGEAIPETDSQNEPYLELVEYLLNLSDEEIPHVLSLSYADDELSVPRPYAERVCNLFGQLAARGMSVIAGSGDGGAAGSHNATCLTNDGQKKEVTMATFPSTCPWVTSVGAVTNSDNPPQGAVFSGGGFSQWFQRPIWQVDAISGYVTELQGQLEGYYDPEKRAVPDISAVGTQFLTVVNGADVLLDGTSASTPVFASIIALADDARLRAGKPSLGWLNPRLYSSEVRKVLSDITTGVSQPCEFSGGKSAGWPATKGWDAITGLGTPDNFNDLLRVLVDVD